MESIEGTRRRYDEPAELPDQEELKDVRLLAAVAAGDQHALGALYRRHSTLLYSLLVRMLGNDMEAREVTQDTFLRIWRRARYYDPTRSSPGAWIVMAA